MTNIVKKASVGGVICIMLTAVVRYMSPPKRHDKAGVGETRTTATGARKVPRRPRVPVDELDAAYEAASRDPVYVRESREFAATWDEVSADGLSSATMSQ